MPAPSSSSLVDRVDDTDQPIGVVRRDRVFEEHAGFRVVHILVRNDAGDLMLQQVGASRERSPMRWGSSVAGYLFADESYVHAAKRRMYEEIGLRVPLVKLGSVRMADRGAAKFIELYLAHAESAVIRDDAHIESLRFWSPSEIERAMDQTPSVFTETFPFVYGLYQTATIAARPQ